MKPIYLIILLCTLFLSTGCKEDVAPQASATDYPTMTLKRTDRTLTETYPATLRGRQDVEIRPQVSGKVVQVCVSEGAHVRKGQTLFVIDQVPYREALQRARAVLATAEAAASTARQNLDAKRLLCEKHIVSDFALRTEESNYRSAVAQVAEARADVRTAENNLWLRPSFCFRFVRLHSEELKTQLSLSSRLHELSRHGIKSLLLMPWRENGGEANLTRAALSAAAIRFRPIVMTVLCMVVGMLPLVFASGVGANGNRSLGLGVVGGLLVGTLALLFVTPTFFIAFEWMEERLTKVKNRHSKI